MGKWLACKMHAFSDVCESFVSPGDPLLFQHAVKHLRCRWLGVQRTVFDLFPISALTYPTCSPVAVWNCHSSFDTFSPNTGVRAVNGLWPPAGLLFTNTPPDRGEGEGGNAPTLYGTPRRDATTHHYRAFCLEVFNPWMTKWADCTHGRT